MDEEQGIVQDEAQQQDLTVEDVQHAVENALSTRDAHDIVIEDMANDLVQIRDGVALLNSKGAEEEETANEEVTYTVRLDSSQVETAKVAGRLVCTEGLMMIILLAISCGLQVWTILQGRWSRG